MLKQIILVALILGGASLAYADEVTLIGPGGVRAAVEKLIPAFERQTGHKVKATFGSGVGTKQQVIKGERGSSVSFRLMRSRPTLRVRC